MTLRELAVVIQRRVDAWPEWKRRAALAGLLTKGDETR